MKRPGATPIRPLPETPEERPYHSIGDVCRMTGLEPHVLRYWESRFEMLRPLKNRAGKRVYRKKDIERVLQIRELLHERGFTIDGARLELLRLRSGSEGAGTGAPAAGAPERREERDSVSAPIPMQSAGIREIEARLEGLLELLSAPLPE